MSSANLPPNQPLPATGVPVPLEYQRREQPIRVVLEQPGLMRAVLGKVLWLVFAVVLFAVMGAFGMTKSYFDNNPLNEQYHSLSKTSPDKIAIIEVTGTIMHTDGFIKQQIDRLRDDDHIKAVVLRVDSPGGTITGSNYIYHHLKEVAEKKQIPVVVSMGGIAASGGYYVSMVVGDETDAIFAEPTTWTGSIGVIIPHYDLSGLLEKYNVADDSIVSHPLKQMGSPTKHLGGEMGERERKILQTLVDESFADFKDIIKSGRPKFRQDSKALDDLATGQIYTAKQALQLGLVDKLGFLEDAINRAAELAKLDKDNVRVVKYVRPHGLIDLDGLLGAAGQSRQANHDLSALLDLAAPRAYYLCTLLPGMVQSDNH